MGISLVSWVIIPSLRSQLTCLGPCGVVGGTPGWAPQATSFCTIRGGSREAEQRSGGLAEMCSGVLPQRRPVVCISTRNL